MTAPHERQARTGADLRLLRAAMFAAVCVVLSAGGHVLASCAAVPLWTLAVAFLAVLAVAAPLAGRERSLPGIAGALAAGQLALHALFGLGQQHGTAMASASAGGSDAASLVERAARIACGASAATITPVQARQILRGAGLEPSGGAHAAHGHAGSEAAGHAATGSMPGMDPAASLLPTLPMLLAHVLAALAAGWLLRRGDLALARLVRLSAQGAYGVAEAALVRSLRAALALVRVLRAGLPGAPLAGPVRAARTLVPSRLRTATLQDTVIRRGPPAPADLALAA
ncbi:hypothetical protein ABT390_11300 [Streptomyces aurantiacus]|uniref:Integral membrane protein n=1 Tax=Streptomyces aurantiacus JA 4570 TaxID=1286094 RepID=S4AFZ5_9ACTN|nr:hypothetical protein [Streptomyces aurantiacus]EPH40407.1 hypothetical protein STRAU_6444 [Streptomyces aurantiacus JA 4570]